MDQSKINTWITGASGQLGRCFQQLAPDRPVFNMHFSDRAEADITEREDIRTFLENHSIDVCINCAAFTDVDGAESREKEAYAVNADGVSNLIDLLPEQCRLIHFSTDYVFDAPFNRPLRTDDPTAPSSVYGQSKRKGEELILRRSKKNSLIIRTSWLYSSFGQNFVKTMLRLASERDALKIVSDQIGSPTRALDLAIATLELIDRPTTQGQNQSSVLHYCNSGVASWYDFAKTIFDYSGHDIEAEPVRTEAFPRPAPRPSYSVLDCNRLSELLWSPIPWWKDSLWHCLKRIQEKNPELFPEGN